MATPDDFDRCLIHGASFTALAEMKAAMEATGLLTTVIPAHGLPPEPSGPAWKFYVGTRLGDLDKLLALVPPVGVWVGDRAMSPDSIKFIGPDTTINAGELLGVPPEAGG